MKPEIKKLILRLLAENNQPIGSEYHTDLLRIYNAGADFGYESCLDCHFNNK